MRVSHVATRWRQGRAFPGQSRDYLRLQQDGKAPLGAEPGFHSGWSARTVRLRVWTRCNSTDTHTALQRMLGAFSSLRPAAWPLLVPRNSPEGRQQTALSFLGPRTQSGGAGARGLSICISEGS